MMIFRLNWWGDPTGPYEPANNPNGLGDKIQIASKIKKLNE
ncbi:MAG: hypothetical protein QXR84_06155 [Candidatus Bathyarchaeia archaeon]